MKIIRKGSVVVLAWTALLLGSNLPSAWSYEAFLDGKKLKFNGFFETINIFRSKNFSKNPILTQNRNTAETEIDFTLAEDWGAVRKWSAFLDGRVFYDGVYDFNDNDFGSDAGEPLPGLPDPAPGFGPNRGFRLLGRRPLQFAVPVRPDDRRGKIPRYLARDKDALSYRAELRELYTDFEIENVFNTGDNVFFRIGKQQIIWGRSDLFRLLDVVNPIDFGRHLFVEEFETIRKPLWATQVVWKFGPTGVFADLNLELDWIWNEFEPAGLGQGGTPYPILGAGDFFRAIKLLNDQGGFLYVGGQPIGINPANGTPLPFAFGGVAFPPGVIGLRNVRKPRNNIGNNQFGARIEAVYGEVAFSLNYFHGRQQLPSLRGINPNFLPFADIHFPPIDVVGGSADWADPWTASTWRFEFTRTHGEEFPDTLKPRLFRQSDTVRYLIGWDRNTFLRWLNPTRTFLFSGQAFFTHLIQHERQGSRKGMPDPDVNVVFTLLIQGFYMSDRLNPRVIQAYDYRGDGYLIAPQIEFIWTDHIDFTASFNMFFGAEKKFDTLLGFNSEEPFGRFREGVIGTFRDNDEFIFRARYRF
jgi:hypothetical protein